jgi:alpha-ketoglutarate-dependent taurine dioxygenase
MITYIDFDDPACAGMVTGTARELLDQHNTGYCIVRNKTLSPDDFMQLLNGTVGESFTVSTYGSHRVSYDIVKDMGEYKKESSIVSASNVSFPLHTDCSFLERPADVVILYCIENSVNGGESLLLHINEIIPRLPGDYIRFLLTKQFYLYSKAYTVLEQAGDLFFIRFNLDEFLSGNYPEAGAIVADLQPLLAVLNDQSLHTTVKLQSNECLIINNRTCLHGRHAFEDNSKRIFYRARHYLALNI